MTPKEHLDSLSKLEKLFLSRRVCGLCEQALHRNSCGAIWDGCKDSDIISRRKSCLETYRPRRTSDL